MKKRMSRIVSILLVSVLVLSTAEVARAEDVTEPVGEEVQVTEEVTEDVVKTTEEVAEPVVETATDESEAEKTQENKAEEAAPVEASAEAEEASEMVEEVSEGIAAKSLKSMNTLSTEKAFEMKSTDTVPVTFAVTGAEQPSGVQISYTAADRKGNNYGYSQAINFSTKGTLDMAACYISGNRSIYFGVFKDANMTQPVDSYNAVSSSGEVGERVFKIPSAGTYYIGLYSISSGNYTAAVAAIFYNGGDRTITNGAQIAVGQKDAQTNYFAFKAIANGYITTMGDTNAGYCKVAICNSSKKVLSGDTYLRYQPVYGVKKGTTYFIRVTSSYSSKGGYIFKVTNSKITEKSGKKKSKAVTIKKGKTKKGTIVAGSSQADWYKFKKTNKKKMVITVKGRTNDTIKVTVYKGKKKYTSFTFNYSSGGKKVTCYNYPKGTYYIKIQRANSASSGWYSVKWK